MKSYRVKGAICKTYCSFFVLGDKGKNIDIIICSIKWKRKLFRKQELNKEKEDILLK